MEVFEVLSQDSVLQCFSQAGVGPNSVSGAEPRGAPRRKSDVGLVARFSDMIMLLALSHGNLDIICEHLPSCSCVSLLRLLEKFLGVGA